MPPERDERIEHLAEVLKSVIRSSGLTGREIERRLGMSGGYTSRLLGGGVELKLSQILAILDVIGLYPSELFAMAFPMSGEASPLMRRIQGIMPVALPGSRPAEAPPVDVKALEEKVIAAVRRALSEDQEKRGE